ncbi:MAG: undecaprenyl-diphosphate phosphatase, partial [Alphaproteobacteria bacterium]
DMIRGIKVVAWNALIFGLLLLLADRLGPRRKKMEDMTLHPALIIGLAQALALIPGTSRSGITITAARALGFERVDAARFSFVLGIPAIAGAGVLTILDVLEAGHEIPPDALMAAAFTFFSALLAIAFLMALVKRLSFTPFVIYRFFLAGFLLVLAYS